MTHFPQTLPNRRAVRKHVLDDVPVKILVEQSKPVHGKLRMISCTGGCALVPRAVEVNSAAEILIRTPVGPVRAIAEMFDVRAFGSQKIQAFRFLALSESDHERLKMTLNSLPGAA